MCMQRLEEVNHDVPLIQGLPINHSKPNLLNGTISFPPAIEDKVVFLYNCFNCVTCLFTLTKSIQAIKGSVKAPLI